MACLKINVIIKLVMDDDDDNNDEGTCSNKHKCTINLFQIINSKQYLQ